MTKLGTCYRLVTGLSVSCCVGISLHYNNMTHLATSLQQTIYDLDISKWFESLSLPVTSLQFPKSQREEHKQTIIPITCYGDVTGELWTLRLCVTSSTESSPAVWSFCLLDASPTGHFAYWTVSSPTVWTFRLQGQITNSRRDFHNSKYIYCFLQKLGN